MQKSLLFIFLFFIPLIFSATRMMAQSKDGLAVKKVLADQADAWNRGSIAEFMKGYWQNDSLQFVGGSGISYGYATALDNYRKTYPDEAKMGKLFFKLIRLTRLSPDYYFVTGQWFLKRSAGDLGGFYTLLFRKIRGSWLIVADHTS